MRDLKGALTVPIRYVRGMPLPPEAPDAQAAAAARGRTSIGRGCGEPSWDVHWLGSYKYMILSKTS